MARKIHARHFLLHEEQILMIEFSEIRILHFHRILVFQDVPEQGNLSIDVLSAFLRKAFNDLLVDRQHLSTTSIKAVEGTRLDEGFHRSFIQSRGRVSLNEVHEILVVSVSVSLGNQSIHEILSDAFDGTKTEQDFPVSDLVSEF